MEATLQALVDLLIRAVPTVLFFIFLSFFLNAILFKPLARILEERRRATEGVRELAQQAYEAADRKASEFEYALAIARGELHQEQEALRRRWTDEQAAAIAAVRREVDAQIAEAKQSIAQEVENARAELESNIELLSERIVANVTERRAA